ncbi:MAG TPA: OmpA family protein [Rhizomicrobium sp.]|jgi:OOP family OmpA-OmpF porin|nr:OmpA family protein [Rhizomicrobium sp.]
MTLVPTSRVARALAVAAALALSGCAGNGLFDDLDQAQPIGSPFQQALFKDYAFVARSFGDVDTSAPTAFDAEDSDSGEPTDMNVSDLATAYAQKALEAAKGNNVAPESPPDGDADAATQHDRLLKDLEAGSDKFPDDSARAQVEYDCWIMNGRVASQHDASLQCRSGLDAALAQLEHDINPAPVVTTTTTTTTTSANYQVYFNLNSWALSAEQLTVLQQAIATARAGGQAHITIVGHTDTSGSAAYNQRLSVKRANVVEEALVDMGARREAISASGVGENDLAVQTGDGVKEPKNRRAVITLIP